MNVRATLRKDRVLRYQIYFCFWKKNTINSVHLCVIRAHFSPVKCSDSFFHPRASISQPEKRGGGVSTDPFKSVYSIKCLGYVPEDTKKHSFIRIFRITLLQEKPY